MPETRPLIGDIVEYRTVPCRTPSQGHDLDLYSNYANDVRMQPIWRPALVTRVWAPDDPASALNLRVFADAGDSEFDCWRTSIPRQGVDRDDTQFACWRPRIHRLDGQHTRDDRTPTRGLSGA